MGKAPIHRTSTAIINGMNMAARKLFYVELLEGRTIYQVSELNCILASSFLILHFLLRVLCNSSGVCLSL